MKKNLEALKITFIADRIVKNPEMVFIRLQFAVNGKYCTSKYAMRIFGLGLLFSIISLLTPKDKVKKNVAMLHISYLLFNSLIKFPNSSLSC